MFFFLVKENVLLTKHILIKILSAVDTQFLKLTKIDDIIHKDFRENFSQLDVKKIDVDSIKSTKSKEVIENIKIIIILSLEQKNLNFFVFKFKVVASIL